MKKIQLKINLTELEDWDVDWNDSSEIFILLSEVTADTRSAISERLGIDRENIEIDIRIVNE